MILLVKGRILLSDEGQSTKFFSLCIIGIQYHTNPQLSPSQVKPSGIRKSNRIQWDAFGHIAASWVKEQ